MEIKHIGSVRTYGGKAHLAYVFVGSDGKERFAVACSCKGTASGQMQRGGFHVGDFANLCKPSIKFLTGRSPVAIKYREELSK